MARILLTSKLFDPALGALVDHELVLPKPEGSMTTEEIIESGREADAIICQLTDRIGETVLSGCPHLQVVATVSVGFDNVDVAAATRAGSQFATRPVCSPRRPPTSPSR